jgi:two-component system cell cycle sensor histidine kinase/response regulator CckA
VSGRLPFRGVMSDKKLPSFEADEESSDYFDQDISTHTIDLQTLVHEIGLFETRAFRDLSETDFGKLLQAIPAPTLLIDRSATIIFANQSWKKINESYRAIVGRPFCSIFPKRSVATAANSIVEKGFTTRKPLVANAVLEIEQTRIWGRMHFRSLRMGNERALIVLVEDLTSEKKQLILTQKHKEDLLRNQEELEKRVKQRTSALKTMNEKLLASRSSFTSIVEKTGEGILVVDSDNMVHYANPSAVSLLGRPRDELVGRHLGLKVFPGQTAEVRGKRLSGESGVLEVRVESTDWNERPAMLLMLRDITDRKRAEQEMLKTEKLESLELVAGGIAHDFNNLLTGTIANISLAKMHAIRGNAQYEALRNAEKAATGAKNLTQQLLTFTKGGGPVKKPGSISRLLKDSITLALSGSSIKSEIKIPSGLWSAEIDEQQIGQVFQNILINGLQAMPSGGTLTTSAENLFCRETMSRPILRAGKYVKVTIRDTG